MYAQRFIEADLRAFATPGSMGVVTGIEFIRCFWPVSSVPFSPFAPGSSGLVVQGPPTPRNIVFPEDTIFAEGTRYDCVFVVAPTCVCRAEPIALKPGQEDVRRCALCCTEIDVAWARVIASEEGR